MLHSSILSATTAVACAAFCVDQSECASAVFNTSESKCSLYESAMSEEVYSSTPNGLVYLVTSSARAEVRLYTFDINVIAFQSKYDQ